MPLWSWSKTASSNATADPTINWAEGQAPSSVNDSARAEMAAVAKFRDDISGAIVTAGTSTAYTVSSNSVFDTLAHMDGAMLAFTPHTTNGAIVTLNVDGLGAKPLRPSPSVELPSGTLVQGTPYVATYSNSDAAWYLRGGISNPYNIPLGGGLPYFGTTAPNSAFVFPFGQAVSRTTYANLFTLFGTTFGTGDGSTTFNIPDLRGRTIAGLDNMGGSAASRLTSTYFGANASTLGATGGLESNNVILTHTHTNTLTDPGHTHQVNSVAPWGAAGAAGGGAGLVPVNNGGAIAGFGTAVSATTGITINNASAGSASAHNIVQPTMVCNFILRII